MAPCEGLVVEPEAEKNNSGKFKDHPTDIDRPFKTAFMWLNGKKIDDDIGPYWRIHDKLYDLTDFIQRHPGGKDWISLTKGSDITEAFESSHISLTPEKMLSKYFVKDITKPRNSPYTFHEDGFYKTFMRKIRPILEKTGKGPSLSMLLIQDGLMLSFLGLAIAGSILYSYTLIVLSGIFLAMTAMCAHNFFHQKDNFRMYYFDLCFLSSYEWRITHGLSHHIFPNTRYDAEITSLEPFLVFLPKIDKNFMQRYGVQIYEFLLLPILFYLELFKRINSVLSGKSSLRPENFLVAFELAVMCSLAPTLNGGFWLWIALHAVCSAWLAGIGLLVAHHHPEIYHDGDKFRNDPDWGLCQLDAVRDRIEIKGNLFMVATTFGDHSLHHLLPTVDHSKLDALYPAFFETCREFNIAHEFLSMWDLAIGFYRQLLKNTPTMTEPGYKTTKQE